MHRSAGGVLLVAFAAVCAGIGGLWAFMKAGGAEVDLYRGSSCTSGWFPATGFLLLALALGLVGAVLIRAGRRAR